MLTFPEPIDAVRANEWGRVDGLTDAGQVLDQAVADVRTLHSRAAEAMAR